MSAELLDRAVTATGAVLANVTPDQMDLATPCASWKVSDLVNHIVGGSYFFAAVASGRELPAGESPDFSAGDYRSAYADGTAQALAAFRAEGAMEATMHAPFGDLPGSAFVMIAAADTLTHGWDLARATGQPSDLDPEAAAQLLTFAHGMMSDDYRGPDPHAPFGPEVTVAEQAPAADRLAGFFGRQP